MPCCCRKYTACDSFSPKIATSTLAPVTSFLPEDCTCRIARWMTRWKPSVGWVSTSRSAAMRGVCSAMCCGQVLAQLVHVGAAGAQHFGRRRVVEQREQQVLDGDEFVALLARLDERHVEADFEFLGNHSCFLACLTLSSASSLRLFHHALQRMLVLSGVCRDLLHLGGGDVARDRPRRRRCLPDAPSA